MAELVDVAWTGRRKRKMPCWVFGLGVGGWDAGFRLCVPVADVRSLMSDEGLSAFEFLHATQLVLWGLDETWFWAVLGLGLGPILGLPLALVLLART